MTGSGRRPSAGRPRDRPPLAHALRRGLRHLPVRRGVAVRRGAAARYLPVLEVAERRDDDGHARCSPTSSRRRGVAERLRDVRARVPARLGRARRRASRRRSSAPPAWPRPTATGAALERLERARRRPARGLRRGRRRGRVALMASSATHAVLPLLATDAGRRLQIDAGLRSHRRRFGEPAGFWLPECAYEPGLEQLLAEHGLEHFCTDQTAPRAAGGRAASDRHRAGPVAFPIDWEAIQWLWSLDGYPSDPALRRLPPQVAARRAALVDRRRALRPRQAAARAREQAREFVAAVAERLRGHRERERGAPGLLVFAIDTELLGHWWWEGPIWLGRGPRGAAGRRRRTGHPRATPSSAHEPEPAAAAAARAGARTRTSRPGTRPRSPTSPGARAASSCGCCASSPPGGSRRRAPSAPRASCWRVRRATGRSSTTGGQAGDYPFERVLDHARALLEAIDSAGRARAAPAQPRARPQPRPAAPSHEPQIAPAS